VADLVITTGSLVSLLLKGRVNAMFTNGFSMKEARVRAEGFFLPSLIGMGRTAQKRRPKTIPSAEPKSRFRATGSGRALMKTGG